MTPNGQRQSFFAVGTVTGVAFTAIGGWPVGLGYAIAQVLAIGFYEAIGRFARPKVCPE